MWKKEFIITIAITAYAVKLLNTIACKSDKTNIEESC